MKNSVFIFFLIILVCIGCGGEEVLPRPKAMLRLTFPAPEYSKWNDGCAYTFMANTLSEPEKK